MGDRLRETRPARRVAPSFRALSRRARFRGRVHDEPKRVDRSDQRPANQGQAHAESPHVEPPRVDDDADSEQAAS
jgi:hypothetical protein